MFLVSRKILSRCVFLLGHEGAPQASHSLDQRLTITPFVDSLFNVLAGFVFVSVKEATTSAPTTLVMKGSPRTDDGDDGNVSAQRHQSHRRRLTSTDLLIESYRLSTAVRERECVFAYYIFLIAALWLIESCG